MKLSNLVKDGEISQEMWNRFMVIAQKLKMANQNKRFMQQKFNKTQRTEDQKVRMEHALVMSEMLRKVKAEEKQQWETNARGLEDEEWDAKNEGLARKMRKRNMKQRNTIRKAAEGDTGKYGKAGVSPNDFGFFDGGVGRLAYRDIPGRDRDNYGYRWEVVGSFLSRTGEHVLKTEEMAHVVEQRGQIFGDFLSPCAFQSVDTECETVPQVNYGKSAPGQVETQFESFVVFSRGFHRGGSKKYGEYCHQYEEDEIWKKTNKLRQEIASISGLRVLPRMQLILHSNEGEYFKQKFDQGQAQMYGIYIMNVVRQENANFSQQKIGEYDKHDYLSRESNFEGREYENQALEEFFTFEGLHREVKHVPGEVRMKKIDRKKGNKQIMKQGASVVDVTNQTYRIVKNRPRRSSGLRSRKQNKYLQPFSDGIEDGVRTEQDVSVSETRSGREGNVQELKGTGRKDLQEMKPTVTTPSIVREEKRRYRKVVEKSQKAVKKIDKILVSPEVTTEATQIFESLKHARRGGHERKPMMERINQEDIARQRLGKRVEGQKEVRLKDSKTSRLKLTLETIREIDQGGRRMHPKRKKQK